VAFLGGCCRQDIKSVPILWKRCNVGRIQGCDPPNDGNQPITFGGTRPWFRPCGPLEAGASKTAFPSRSSHRYTQVLGGPSFRHGCRNTASKDGKLWDTTDALESTDGKLRLGKSPELSTCTQPADYRPLPGFRGSDSDVEMR